MKFLISFVLVAFAVASPVTDEGSSSPTTHVAVGGKIDVPVDDKIVNEILTTNLARLAAGDSSFELVSIKKITKQVVAGLKYEINGTFQRGGKNVDCVLTVWNRSWLEDPNEKVKLRADCGGEAVNAKNDEGAW